MASPLKYFRKHQKFFLVVAAVIAMFVFVFADMFISMSNMPARSARDEQVSYWKGGKLTEGEVAMLTERRLFIDDVLFNFYMGGASRIESEGGTPTAPSVPVEAFLLPRQGSKNQRAFQARLKAVDERVLSTLAREAGMYISDSTINDYLIAVGLGRVTKDEMRVILERVGGRGDSRVKMSENMLFDGLREVLLAHLYESSLVRSAEGMQPAGLWDDWRTLNERISLEAVVLPAEDFVAEVEEPSDEQLQQYYEANRERDSEGYSMVGGRRMPQPESGFRERPKVRLKYLVGDVSAWTQKKLDEVTEEEIVDYYERNKRSFLKYDPVFDEESELPGMIDEMLRKGQADSESDEAEEESQGEADDAEDVETEAEPDAGTEAAEEEPTVDQGEAELSDEMESENGSEVEESVKDAAEATAPAAEESSAIGKPSPFRLAALQADEAAGPESGSSPPSEPTATEASETDMAKSAESSDSDESDATQDAETAPAEDESDGESAEASEDDSAYQPLENVREQIRRDLATTKAVEHLSEEMDTAYSKLLRVYDRYGRDLAASKDNETDPPPVPEQLSDLSAIAKEYSLISEETLPLTIFELEDTDVGRSEDSETRTRRIAQLAFSGMVLHEPTRSVSLDGLQYLVIKVEDIPAETPPFEDIRDQVAEAWKLSEAETLALEKGKEIAKRANEEELDLAEARGEQEYQIAITDFFSKVTFGTTANSQRSPMLGEALPLEYLGREFLDEAFSLENGKVVAVPNFTGEQVYVIRVHQRERTQQELQDAFVNAFRGNSDQLNFVYNSQVRTRMSVVRGQAFAKAEYDRNSFIRALQKAAMEQ